MDEGSVQARTRLAYAKKGNVKLFRNNNGAFKDATGRIVRYGLANESKAINEVIKTGDLIGWEEITITPDMVGQRIARFLSIECKRQDWKPNANDTREQAQRRWADLVNKAGGVARFINDPDQV